MNKCAYCGKIGIKLSVMPKLSGFEKLYEEFVQDIWACDNCREKELKKIYELAELIAKS